MTPGQNGGYRPTDAQAKQAIQIQGRRLRDIHTKSNKIQQNPTIFLLIFLGYSYAQANCPNKPLKSKGGGCVIFFGYSYKLFGKNKGNGFLICVKQNSFVKLLKLLNIAKLATLLMKLLNLVSLVKLIIF